MRFLPALLLVFTAACTAPVVSQHVPEKSPILNGPLLIDIRNMDENGRQRIMPEIYDLIPDAEKDRFTPFKAYRTFHDDNLVERGLCDNMLQYTDAKGHMQRRCGGHAPSRNEIPPSLSTTPAVKAPEIPKTAAPGKTVAK